MKCMDVIVPGLFIVACGLAIYQSQKENWPINRKLGNIIFLFGVAIALFLDDFVVPKSALHSWAELIGVAVILVGVLIRNFWQPN